MVSYVSSQNVDALHLRSGVPRDRLSELHGNLFAEICTKCGHECLREADVGGVGLRETGVLCEELQGEGGVCGGAMRDNTLDWDDALPELDLARTEVHSHLVPPSSHPL
jgi:mono-ADP-ribosyltransferase sirtuin 6